MPSAQSLSPEHVPSKENVPEKLRWEGRSIPSAPAWMPLLVIVVGCAVYANSFRGLMLFDDVSNIVQNDAVHAEGFRDLLSRSVQLLHGNRPVVDLTLALNHAISGLKPWSYHALNLAVHLAAALLFFGIVRRTVVLGSARTDAAGEAQWIALSAALIWVVHPLQTQSVTFIIQRCESMMGLFYMMSLYALVRAGMSTRGWPWLIVCIGAATLGMGCKEVTVSLPLVLLIYDRLFISRGWGPLLRRHGWAFLLVAVVCLMLMPSPVFTKFLAPRLTQLMKAPESSGVHSASNAVGSSGEYARTQIAVVTHYIQLTFWPWNQCLDYGWEAVHSLREVAGRAVFLGVLLLATLWALVRRPVLGFWGAWFFITLALRSSVVPFQDAAVEHRMYLPLAGIVAAVVIGAAGLIRMVALGGRDSGVKGLRNNLHSARSSHPLTPQFVAKFGAGAVVAMIVILLGALTVRRNAMYHDRVALWRENATIRPRNTIAQLNLGWALFDAGRIAESGESFRAASELEPRNAAAHQNLGIALQHEGRTEEAIEHYRIAVALVPSLAVAQSNLCEALLSRGHVDEAIAHGELAVKHKPKMEEAWNNLGRALGAAGRHEEACAAYAKALVLRPTFAKAYFNLGRAQRALGRMDDAASSFRAAIAINPKLPYAHRDLARVAEQNGDKNAAMQYLATGLAACPGDFDLLVNYAVLLHGAGQLDEAVAKYREAVAIRPGHAGVHNALGGALFSKEDFDGAASEFRKAIAIDPKLLEAHFNLGLIAERRSDFAEAREHYQRVLEIDSGSTAARQRLEGISGK
jgi:tetratricopeptide (TPR) repeat protein